MFFCCILFYCLYIPIYTVTFKMVLRKATLEILFFYLQHLVYFCKMYLLIYFIFNLIPCFCFLFLLLFYVLFFFFCLLLYWYIISHFPTLNLYLKIIIIFTIVIIDIVIQISGIKLSYKLVLLFVHWQLNNHKIFKLSLPSFCLICYFYHEY